MVEISKSTAKPVRLDKAVTKLARDAPTEADRARFAELLQKLETPKLSSKTHLSLTDTQLLPRLIEHLMPSLQDPDILTLDRQRRALEVLERQYGSQRTSKAARLAVVAIRRELKWLKNLSVGINSVIGN
jgi:hypothetical protein